MSERENQGNPVDESRLEKIEILRASILDGRTVTNSPEERFAIVSMIGHDVPDLIAEVRALRAELASRDGWTRTADRLPTEADANEHGYVLWWSSLVECAIIGPWVAATSWRTHWRPLPAPPADEEGGDDAPA